MTEGLDKERMNDLISICSWSHLGYVCRFMQPSDFLGLLVTQSNWKFLISPPPHQNLHFTRSSTHSNVYKASEIRGKLNQIKSPEIARRSAERGQIKRKGICYLTPASHLISPDCLETISHSVKGEPSFELSTKSPKPPVVLANLLVST